MIFFLLIILIIVANIIGCLKTKRTLIKVFLAIAALGWMMFIIFCGLFVYETEYKINEIAYSKSLDGEYELFLQQIGDPDFPFGHNHVRFILKSEENVVVEYNFDIANDGKNINEENWVVTWDNDYVIVIVYGEEQYDAKYVIYFDGEVQYYELDTQYGVK